MDGIVGFLHSSLGFLAFALNLTKKIAEKCGSKFNCQLMHVIGGISFLLYGMIGASGIRILVDSRVDYGRSRNLILTSVVFVTGLSGIAVNIGNIQLTGMVLACIVGMILSLIFHLLDRLNLTNDRG